MTMPPNSGNPVQAGMALLENLAKLPAPEKVFFELQRLNNNMERLQPDLLKLNNNLEKLNTADIRALTTVLQGMKVSEMLLALNEANSTIKKLYEKLWGPK